MGLSKRERQRTCSASRGGFTLIEVLVAVTILAVGIVVVMRAFDTSLVALAASRETLVANELIREKMAEIDLSLVEDPSRSLSSSSGRFARPYDNFSYDLQAETVEVSSEYAASSNVLYRIRLKVHRDGSRREQAIETFVRGKR